eukprot:GHVN01058100.1.p1 GENE.GHVN01058100.1~~GHVN01058100.1.p1  ORF type:complete len:336 (-),score=23.18 GHVN01058100.1:128-1135(-)
MHRRRPQLHTKWDISCEGIPMCAALTGCGIDDVVEAYTHVNYECSQNRFCFLVRMVSDKNIIGNPDIVVSLDGKFAEGCFPQSQGCFNTVAIRVQTAEAPTILSTSIFTVELMPSCCTSEPDCFLTGPESAECSLANCLPSGACAYDPIDPAPANCETETRPDEDMENDCYTGNVCDGNACVPTYAPFDSVCGEAELCRKMRCQLGSSSSRTTCEAEISDDGTLCSNPSLRGDCDAGDKCIGGICVVEGDGSYNTGKVCRASTKYCDTEEVCESRNFNCPEDVDMCPVDGEQKKPHSPHSPHSPHYPFDSYRLTKLNEPCCLKDRRGREGGYASR